MTNDLGSGGLRLYEVVLKNGRSASPFVWRIRYALAHKRIAYESVPLGLVEIPQVFVGRFKTVPIIEHGHTVMAESWDIADYIDRVFPQQPPLFSSAGEHSMVRLFDEWFFAEVVRPMVPIYALDTYNAVRPADRAYFRDSRETRFGSTLEALSANRAARLPSVREALGPLRRQLGTHAFLGGNAPNYADYIALGVFKWVSSVASLPLLASDDEVLRSWISRGFDLYDDSGCDTSMNRLFE